MQRREFFRSGAWAAAGVGGAAIVAGQAQPAQAAAPRATPTIFDFGAVGDGVTDDSAAFRAALDAAAREGRKVIVPGYTYAIGKPIDWVSQGNATRQWGLESQGAVLQSRLSAGQDIFKMTSRHVVRYFALSGGLTIRGNGSEGYGLRLSCPADGNGRYFYNCLIDQVSVENAGQDGLLFDGNVFESQVTNSFFQDNKRNGATFAHHGGGICSSINVIGCYFNQNGRHGMESTTLDSKYGGATDVRVIGGYMRDNQMFGLRYNNGTATGAGVFQVGFENNFKKAEPGVDYGAHVYARVRLTMRDCMGYTEHGGSTHLVRGWFSDVVTLDGCSHSSGGAMRSTGKARLIQVDGSADGHVIMRSSSGGVAEGSNNHATWEAANCTGPTPTGACNPRGAVLSV